jgi:hypothetical protein
MPTFGKLGPAAEKCLEDLASVASSTDVDDSIRASGWDSQGSIRVVLWFGVVVSCSGIASMVWTKFASDAGSDLNDCAAVPYE